MTSPKKVIFTTMKNEGAFMLEWIAYNRSIGVDGTVIYTNNCDDGTDQIAMRLEEMGLAYHVENPVKPGGNPQHQALRRARNHPWVKNAEWLMCLDVDEFINIHVGDRSLDALIDAVGDVDAVSIVWRLFGCGGVEEFTDQPVMDQFHLADHETASKSARSYGFKTLFRNNGTFGRFGPHRPKGVPDEKIADVKWCDAGGNLRPMDKVGWSAWPGFSHEYARLNHYAVRSIESFLVKRDRGRTNHINVDQAESYWDDMNRNFFEDKSVAQTYERAKPFLAELLADPVLAKLHAGAVDWHANKISELKLREDWAEFRDWLKVNKLKRDV